MNGEKSYSERLMKTVLSKRKEKDRKSTNLRTVRRESTGSAVDGSGWRKPRPAMRCSAGLVSK